MIASLPMYDLPGLGAASDAWWAGLARALRRAGVDGVPAALHRDGPAEEHWAAPGLLFSQTCGYPLTHRFAGRLRPLATPCYRAPGCEGPRYSSAIVVGADSAAGGLADLRGATAACNYRDSQSGYNAFRAAIAPLAGGAPFFDRVATTGSHAASLAAVASGAADVAAIDAVTHALLSRADAGAIRRTRVLAWTPSSPGLPYVTRADADDETVARMRNAVDGAMHDPDLAAAREALLIGGAAILEREDYADIPRMERAAAAAGYPELR